MKRISWDLRADVAGVDAAEDWDRGFFELDAPQVLPGDYVVTVRAGGIVSSQLLTVLSDPRVDIEAPDRWLRRDAILEGVNLSHRLGLVQRAADDVHVGVQRVRDLFSEVSDADAAALAAAAEALLENLEMAVDLEPAQAYRREVAGLSSSYDTPTEAQRLEMARLSELVDALEYEINIFIIGVVACFRDQVLAANLEVFPSPRLIGN
jgi:hypothetical protein